MKTTLDIPDEIYRRAEMMAAQENREMKDLVSEGLRLVLGLAGKSRPAHLRRMQKAPVSIRSGNVIRVLSNDEMAGLS